MLTVVIPAYNVETYIGTCLRSVLDQTRTRNDVRVIVVLDGPTD
jgi:glycosyltransferase involved in cell wall biosynthesis